MNYLELKIGKKIRWVANPCNWEELKYTLHNEYTVFMKYNPNKSSLEEEVLKKFKQ